MTIILGLLGTVFVTLKLTGQINWSWWLVTAPFWGVFVLVLAYIGIMILAHEVFYVVEKLLWL